MSTSTPIPSRPRGCTRLCVQEGFSAPNDGTKPANDAINAAFAALPESGGEVHVPAGLYLMDSNPLNDLKPRSRSALIADPGAVFITMPNNLKRDYAVLLQDLHDFEWDGGRIIGDLSSYVPSGTSTDEWGHNMAIYGCVGVTIRNLVSVDAVGDAWSVGGAAAKPTKDLIITNVTGDGCRRQGLSLVNADGVLVVDSTFKSTGLVQGTKPMCGIDVEPEAKQVAKNIRLLRLLLTDNARYGINIQQRSDGGIIDGVDVEECLVVRNRSNGVVAIGGKNVRVFNSTLRENSATGCVVDGVANFRYAGNTSGLNYARTPLRTPRAPFDLAGWSSRIERDVILKNSPPALDMPTNHYV